MSTELPLTKLSETAATITLGWTPIPCRGYAMYRQGEPRPFSHSWDSGKRAWPVAKTNLPVRVVALGTESEGAYPSVAPPPPPPPSAGTIPAHQVIVQPGGHDATGDKKCFCWVQHTSPTTQMLGDPEKPGTYNHPRSIAWAPGDLYKPGDTVWILYHWKPEENDSPGRLLNLHTNEHRGGYEPGHADVSPIALDWFSSGNDVEGDPGLRLGIEEHPNHHVPLLPYATVKAAMAPGHPGFDITLAIELKRPGLIRCWVDGVLKQSHVQNPFYPLQTGFWVIAGSYRWDGIASTVKVRQTAERIGHSLGEALADRPAFFGAYGSRNAAGQPGYSRNALPPYDVSAFRAPQGIA